MMSQQGVLLVYGRETVKYRRTRSCTSKGYHNQNHFCTHAHRPHGGSTSGATGQSWDVEAWQTAQVRGPRARGTGTAAPRAKAGTWRPGKRRRWRAPKRARGRRRCLRFLFFGVLTPLLFLSALPPRSLFLLPPAAGCPRHASRVPRRRRRRFQAEKDRLLGGLLKTNHSSNSTSRHHPGCHRSNLQSVRN